MSFQKSDGRAKLQLDDHGNPHYVCREDREQPDGPSPSYDDLKDSIVPRPPPAPPSKPAVHPTHVGVDLGTKGATAIVEASKSVDGALKIEKVTIVKEPAVVSTPRLFAEVTAAAKPSTFAQSEGRSVARFVDRIVATFTDVVLLSHGWEKIGERGREAVRKDLAELVMEELKGAFEWAAPTAEEAKASRDKGAEVRIEAELGKMRCDGCDGTFERAQLKPVPSPQVALVANLCARCLEVRGITEEKRVEAMEKLRLMLSAPASPKSNGKNGHGSEALDLFAKTLEERLVKGVEAMVERANHGLPEKKPK